MWPLRLFSATGMAGAGGGRAKGGKVTGCARWAQPRQHWYFFHFRGSSGSLTRPAQRARRRPHREHERQHNVPIAPRVLPFSDPFHKHSPRNTFVCFHTFMFVTVTCKCRWAMTRPTRSYASCRTRDPRAARRGLRASATATICVLGSKPTSVDLLPIIHSTYPHYWLSLYRYLNFTVYIVLII